MTKYAWPSYWRVVLATVFATGHMGCMREYKPPTSSEPHAAAKLRRVYETSGGVSLLETVQINDQVGFAKESPASLKAARTDALLVHPGPAAWKVSTDFYHTETRYVQESYQKQEPYSATESYSCGSGTSSRTCTRTVTRYRSVTAYRNVWKNIRVSDGRCSAQVSHEAKDGGVYLLQYTYQAPNVCRLSCFEQHGSANTACTPTKD